MPKFVRNFIEQKITAEDRITINASEKIIAVRVKNQGTATVYTAWGGETGISKIDSGAADNFDGGDSGYLEGSLRITFSPTGTKDVIVLKLRDEKEICD